VLVLIGADANGKKELLAIEDGSRESEQSWHELLVRLRDENGLVIDPELATGGALGFWKAARKVWPSTRAQRCWIHKTANVLIYLPKSVQPKAKGRPPGDLRSREPGRCRGGVRLLPRQVRGEVRQGRRLPGKGPRRPARLLRIPGRALERRIQSRARSRPCACRPTRPSGCLSRATALALVFKLAESAERHWRRLNGSDRLAEIIRGVRFATASRSPLPRTRPLPDLVPQN
jgi:putative transposase